MVKDAFGVELNPGDRVVYVEAVYRDMREGRVMYVTSKGVRIMPKRGDYELHRKAHYVVKIGGAE